MDHSQAVHVLRRLYSHKRSGFAHEEESRSDNLTYGELTVLGMRSLLKASNLTNEDVFTDLGSGTGKLLVYVALRSAVKCCIGVEIGEKRSAVAQAVSEQLAQMDPACPPFRAITGDILKPIYSESTVIYFCNVIFDLQMQNRAVDNMLKTCPKLRLVIAAAPLVHPRLVRQRGFLGDCTWGSGISMGLYSPITAAESLARFKPTVAIQRNPRLKRSEFPDVDVGTSSKVLLHPWFDGYFQARLLPLNGGNKTAREGASAQQRERGSAERSGSSTARGKVAGSTGGLGPDATMSGGVGQASLLSAAQHAIALPMKMSPLVAPPALVVLPVVLPSDAAVLPISRGGGQLQSLRGAAQRYASLGQKQQQQHLGRAAFR